jgi:hypothetical protein
MEKLSSNLYPRINLDSMTTMAYSIRPYTSNYLSILLLINQMI